MTLSIAISGIGTVGGFGCGVAALETALDGSPPVPAIIELETIHGPRRVCGLRADTRPLRDAVPVRVLRRMEHHIRIALLAAFDALGDAQRRGYERPERLGIVMATGYGSTCNSFDFQHLAIAGDDFSGSPTQFSNSVHNAAAAYLSIALKENGPNHSVSHYDLSVPMALQVAAQWLDEGRVSSVLVGAVDEFSKAQACAWQDRADSNPADARLPAIGEGACFLLLTTGTAAQNAYACIDAVGLGRQLNAGRQPDVPEADRYIIGADGYGGRDGDYPTVLPGGRPAAAYSHVYGVLPVGMAFDLAIAALSVDGEKRFTGAQLPALEGLGRDPGRPKSGERFCCLKLGAEQGFGWATLRAPGRRQAP